MAEGIPQLPQSQEPQEILDPNLLHAVFVDDNRLNRELNSAMFVGKFDSLEVFEKPKDVIARFEREDLPKPDVLLTDGEMPEMTGLELARHIRGRYPATTIVLISAGIAGINMDKPEELAKQLKSRGIDLFLEKPISRVQADELVDTIKTLRQQTPRT